MKDNLLTEREVKRVLETLNNADIQNALQDPFARFVMLTIFRIRKFIRIITFGKWCKID